MLLTGDGVQFLKEMCVRNLDMKAKDDVETALLQKFMDKAKEVCVIPPSWCVWLTIFTV